MNPAFSSIPGAGAQATGGVTAKAGDGALATTDGEDRSESKIGTAILKSSAIPTRGHDMNAVLTLNSEELDDVRLHALTLDLCNAINDAGADGDVSTISARSQPASAQEGSKGGDLVTLGTILLTLIGSGGVVVTLIEVLKAYVMRDRHLKINIKAKNGVSIDLDGSNLAEKQLHETTELLQKVLGG